MFVFGQIVETTVSVRLNSANPLFRTALVSPLGTVYRRTYVLPLLLLCLFFIYQPLDLRTSKRTTLNYFTNS